jgi:hypothetical protein
MDAGESEERRRKKLQRSNREESGEMGRVGADKKDESARNMRKYSILSYS